VIGTGERERSDDEKRGGGTESDALILFPRAPCDRDLDSVEKLGCGAYRERAKRVPVDPHGLREDVHGDNWSDRKNEEDDDDNAVQAASHAIITAAFA
jgi:hypothetical protein